MRCRCRTGASSGATKRAARNVALEVHAHLRALGVSERIEAVVAVPADLDASALTALRGALSAAGVDTRDFLDSATLTAAAVDRSQPLRGARCRLAFGNRDARVRRRRMHLRRSLRERARQPARRLRPVAHRRGRRHGEEHALRSAAQPRRRAAPVRRPAVARRACRHRRQGRSRRRSPMARDSPSPSMRSCLPTRRSRSIASSRASRAIARIAGQDAALVLPAESRRWPGFLPRLLELEQDGLVIAPAGLAAVAASLQTTDPAGHAAAAPPRGARRQSQSRPPTSNTWRRPAPRPRVRCR